MRTRSIAVAAVALLALTGCAGAGPSADEIEDRFAIEIAGYYSQDETDPKVRELAATMSENAEEDCHDTGLWALLPEDLRVIHASACLVLYDDLDPGVEAQYARTVAEHVG